MLQVPLLSDQVHNVQQMLSAIAMVVGSGVLCGIVSIGVLPLIENAFNLTTPTKLLELSDPTHPLTKRLMIEAPGTYHHSILVANLAEADAMRWAGSRCLRAWAPISMISVR